MGSYELFLIAVSLSMDAFAVSVCKGLSSSAPGARHCLICGVYFGGFQALMPVLGWLMGVRFQQAAASADHWIAFLLLELIGFNMVREARSGGEPCLDASISPRAMLPLAVATSIDALAVGITFACLQVDILRSASLIGVTTLVLSCAGVKVGALFGGRFRSAAELAGGATLMFMGLKLLLEHTLLG